MPWLLIAIFSYSVLAFVSLVDKFFLEKNILNPKIYAFYVGVLGVLSLFFIPFVGFYIPQISQVVLGLSAGAVFIYSLFWFYKTIQLFELSRVVPAIGGLTPLFSFFFVFILTLGQETLSLRKLFAFVLLTLGSFLIIFKKEKLINLKSLKFSLLTSFLSAFSLVLIKCVYLTQPFWNGLIWRCLGGFLMAVCFFVLFPEVRQEVFKKRKLFDRKKMFIFIANQAGGAGASILQNLAISMVPLIYTPFINALQGVQYVFLFIFVLILSLKRSLFEMVGLKEEISGKIVFQKIIAIFLIGGGLFVLAF